MQDIKYQDNIDILTCIEGRLGLIDILNEECFRPKGSDFGFVNKIYLNAKKREDSHKSPLYTKRDFRDHEFGIQHFAGPVRYNASQFVMKNMDNLSPSVVECGCKSSNDLIYTGFNKMTKKKSSVKNVTVWAKFNTQMNTLMSDIKKTERRYVRCIVPNKEKKAKLTDLPYTLTQLRCAGVMSAVTISRAAFPNRMALETALSRFEYLIRGRDERFNDTKMQSNSPLQEKVSVLLDAALKGQESLADDGVTVEKKFVIGKTKVYFRAGALEYLEEERLITFDRMATIIQSCVRRKIAREAWIVLMMKRKDNALVSSRTKKKKKTRRVSIFWLGRVFNGIRSGNVRRSLIPAMSTCSTSTSLSCIEKVFVLCPKGTMNASNINIVRQVTRRKYSSHDRA